MIEAVIWGAATVPLFMLAAGLRRIPWRYGAIVGLGYGLVFATLRLSQIGVDPGLKALSDPGMFVLLGALGATISTTGFEHGERERKRRSAEILASPQSSGG